MTRLVAALNSGVLRHLREAEDARQHVVEVMRHTTGQCAQGFELARAGQLGLQGPPRLGVPSIGTLHQMHRCGHHRQKQREPDTGSLGHLAPWQKHRRQIARDEHLDAVARHAVQAHQVLAAVTERAHFHAGSAGQSFGDGRLVECRGCDVDTGQPDALASEHSPARIGGRQRCGESAQQRR